MREASPVSSAPAVPPRTARRLAAAGAALLAAWASEAQAQTINNNGGSLNGGYSNSFGSLNSPIDVSTRDANQNSVFINGIMQAPAGSVFSRASGFSQDRSGSGSGVGSMGLATAIGNNLQVVVQGSYNRVTVDSTQINNGDISANASLNGQVDLDAQ
jgi:holdfast attachment protein HfaA